MKKLAYLSIISVAAYGALQAQTVISDFSDLNALADFSIGDGSWEGNVLSQSGVQRISDNASTLGGGRADFASKPIDLTYEAYNEENIVDIFVFEAGPATWANEWKISLIDGNDNSLYWIINSAVLPQFSKSTIGLLSPKYNYISRIFRNNEFDFRLLIPYQEVGIFDYSNIVALEISGTATSGFEGPFSAIFDNLSYVVIPETNSYPLTFGLLSLFSMTFFNRRAHRN